MQTLTEIPTRREPRPTPIEPPAEPDVLNLLPIRVEEIARNEEEDKRHGRRAEVERRFQLD